MDVSIADAKNRLTELIRAVENGEKVVITRHGKPVAQLAPAPPRRKVIQWGSMKGEVKFKPGWDEPIELDDFLAGKV